MKSPFDTPGPTPGPKGVVKQHHAMASGYELPMTERKVKTFQKDKSTGCTYVPGFNSPKSKKEK